MALPTTLHIGRPCHMMHSQGPRRTPLLRPLRSRAGGLSQAGSRALVGPPRMRGRHLLSLTPAHVIEGLQHVGVSSLQPTPAPLPIMWLWGCCTGGPPTAVAAAAAVVQQLFSCRIAAQQPLGCCSMWAAALCSPPPPRYQCKGYGGAAPTAFPLQLQLLCCGSFRAAAVMQQHFGCCFRAVGAVALVLLQWAAAHCSQPPPRYQPRGYGGVAPAAVLLQPLQLSCRSGCSSCPAAVIMQQHVSTSARQHTL